MLNKINNNSEFNCKFKIHQTDDQVTIKRSLIALPSFETLKEIKFGMRIH